MNNLTSYCGLVDAKIRASDKDLPVTLPRLFQTCSVDVFLLFSPESLVSNSQNSFLPINLAPL